MKHVLIVTSGRSGSTLLTGILNAIEGWHIKGENNNIAFGLFQSFQAFEEAQVLGQDAAGGPPSPWFGATDMSPDDYRKALSRPLRAFLRAGTDGQDYHCLGYKEIRYFDIFKRDPTGRLLRAYLNFLLRALAPCSLVMLTRNSAGVRNSGFFALPENQGDAQGLNKFAGFLKNFAAKRPGKAFHLTYDDMVNQTDNFTRLFDFLGAAPAPDDLTRVLATPHSYQMKSIHPFAVPPNWAKQRDNQDLFQADRLTMLGQKEKAKPFYARAVQAYDRGEIATLPVHAGWRSGQQRYVFRRSENHPLAYLVVPKCACTSISRKLFELDNGTARMPVKGTIHDYYYSRQISVSDPGQLGGYYRFSVVRDPIERFLSGYRNRIVFHQDLKETLRVTQGVQQTPSCENFARNLGYYCTMDINVENHFLPQSVRLGKDLAVFDGIFPIENIAALETTLSEKTGATVKFARHQSDGPKIGLDALSQTALQGLLEFYAEDYRLLKEWYTPDRIRALHEAAGGKK